MAGEVPCPSWIRGGARKLLSVRDRLVLRVLDRLFMAEGASPAAHTFLVVGDGDQELTRETPAAAGPFALLRALPNVSLSYFPESRRLLGSATILIGDSHTCELAMRLALSSVGHGLEPVLLLGVDGPPVSRATGVRLSATGMAGYALLPGWSAPRRPCSIALAEVFGIKVEE